jgi:hypothetical protein
LTVVVVIIVIIVALAIVAAVAAALRGTSSGDLAAPTAAGSIEQRPALADFHVAGETATVSYDVPLPPGEVDPHLRDLLLHDAARVVGEKAASGLPIDQVKRVRANGKRDGEYSEAGTLILPEPGVLPEVTAPDLVPHAAAGGYDPLAHIGEHEFEVQPGIAAARTDEDLEPFGADLEMSREVEASLRAAGIDPDGASLEDITLGLLAMGGYAVTPLGATKDGAPRYMARARGEETLVQVLPHRQGEHPELSEQALNEFSVAVAERNPTRALLITDKFGPYLIYERERRNPKCRFITRERLQTFVDGFALR